MESAFESDASSGQSRSSCKPERTKARSSKFYCDYPNCNTSKAFRRKFDLKRHQRTKHSSEPPLWYCGYCYDEQAEKVYGANRKDHVLQHMRKIHKMGMSQTSHSCPVNPCYEGGTLIFSTLSSLDKHKFLEHNNYHIGEDKLKTGPSLNNGKDLFSDRRVLMRH